MKSSDIKTLALWGASTFAGLWLIENVLGFSLSHHAAAAGGPGDVATGFHAGCPRDANPGGNSPGWYTQGSNTEKLHHHCDWKQKCCFATDVPKAIKAGVPPFRPGDCRPDWGTASYVGGSNYPKTADFSLCPAGTLP